VKEPAFSEAPSESVALTPERAREIRVRDLLVRFAFGAATSTVAGLITIAFGPRAGGVFLAFPAILAATLTLIADEDTARQAREDARGAIIGSIGLGAFAAAGTALFGTTPGALVLVVATAGWAIVAIGGYFAIWH
jgi:hypothetical protein